MKGYKKYLRSLDVTAFGYIAHYCVNFCRFVIGLGTRGELGRFNVLHSGTKEVDDFVKDVLGSLAKSPRELQCKYFYDEEGSRLFDMIYRLKEYYPTRCELEIMENRAREIVGLLGAQCLLIKLGGSSSVKTRIILDNLESPAGYVPIS